MVVGQRPAEFTYAFLDLCRRDIADFRQAAALAA
jgi:hypothetical protein